MPQPVLAFIIVNPSAFINLRERSENTIMDCCRVSLIVFVFVLATAALLHSATAETFTVLGTEGWSIPTTGNDGVYRAWAADKEFKIGDVLVFNFPTGAHDVTEVTKANYYSCSNTNPIITVTTGPGNVYLTTAGMHYYICSFGQHCTSGQKLAINVTDGCDESNTRTPPTATISPSGTRTPAATPPGTRNTPTTTTSSPPSPSSASSITFCSFPVAILSIVLVFLH